MVDTWRVIWSTAYFDLKLIKRRWLPAPISLTQDHRRYGTLVLRIMNKFEYPDAHTHTEASVARTDLGDVRIYQSIDAL